MGKGQLLIWRITLNEAVYPNLIRDIRYDLEKYLFLSWEQVTISIWMEPLTIGLLNFAIICWIQKQSSQMELLELTGALIQAANKTLPYKISYLFI